MPAHLFVEPVVVITPDVARFLQFDVRGAELRARQDGVQVSEAYLDAVAQIQALARLSRSAAGHFPGSLTCEMSDGGRKSCQGDAGNHDRLTDELCAKEAAKVLAMVPRNLTRLASAGKIPHRRLNGDSGPYLFRREDLVAYLEKQAHDNH